MIGSAPLPPTAAPPPRSRPARARGSPRRAFRRASRQRGGAALLIAILLPVLVAIIALVVDVGYLYRVRAHLQNAADSAALAGVRDLNGTPTRFDRARAAAQAVGRLHTADGRVVALDTNDGNAPDGDIVLGTWSFHDRSFTPATPSTPAYLVNAVEVHARRSATVGGSVATFFARVIGRDEAGVAALAVAAGGSPAGACGFPLAVPDCSLIDAAGALRCDTVLRFSPATTDNTGFTLLHPDPPVSTPGIQCHMDTALGFPCKPPCDCSPPDCNPTSTAGGPIYISNGNNLSAETIDHINQAVAAHPEGLFVVVPVLVSNLSPAQCASFPFNRQQIIAGYVMLRILQAQKGPPREIYLSVDCTHTSGGPPGGPFFGLASVTPYLVL